MSGTYCTDEEASSISGHLIDIASNKDVWVLKAVDRGSRARKIADDTSDYDVFFTFAQPHADYVVEGTYTDTITVSLDPDETSLGREIEFHGWNLRKLVGNRNEGYLSSDPMSLEFIASDLVYYTSPCTEETFDELESHVTETFKPYQLMAHYRSLALGNYGTYIRGDGGTTTDRSVKRYLHICQALCKRHYVAETRELPAMDVNELLRSVAGVIPEDVYATIGDLAVRKRDGDGGMQATAATRELLDAWITSVDVMEPTDELTDRHPDPDVLREHVHDILQQTY